jgi:hypothetical protein
VEAGLIGQGSRPIGTRSAIRRPPQLKDRANKILEQAEQLASEAAADERVVAQAKEIAAEARIMVLDARPAKKMES